MRKILFDANVLIGAFDGKPGNAADDEARDAVRRLLSDEDVLPVITPLVRFEVLRGMRRKSPAELEAALIEMERALDVFEEILVREKEARRAAEIFRLAKGKGMNPDKRSFDIFYCVCAETHRLESMSHDKDIDRIQKLMRENPPNPTASRPQ